MIRSNKIRQYARGKACLVQIPHGLAHDPATSVMAHVGGISAGKGTGIKASDLHVVIACANCHDIMDGRASSDFERDFIELCAWRGHGITLYLLQVAGLVEAT